jgi:hypothetical protein
MAAVARHGQKQKFSGSREEEAYRLHRKPSALAPIR